REDHLLHLAAVLLDLREPRVLLLGEIEIADPLLAGEQRLLDDLLRDRRAALADRAARAEVLDRGAADADRVEALVRVEPAVLGGDERRGDVRRHPLERDDPP